MFGDVRLYFKLVELVVDDDARFTYSAARDRSDHPRTYVSLSLSRNRRTLRANPRAVSAR